MKASSAKRLVTGSAFILLAWLMGCKKEEEPKARVPVPVNSFSMQVNRQVWTPYQAPDDPCRSTYSLSQGGIIYNDGRIEPRHTIYAYRDPNGRADAYSENMLRIQVMNLTEPGIYLLDGSYTLDFDSYIIFTVKQPAGNYKRYINLPTRRPFVVQLQEFFPPSKGLSMEGIKGYFAGVIYNEANPSDSLVIEKGAFTFKYLVNSHCEP